MVQRRYPDFTLLSDSFGLLVLEVKGRHPRQLVGVTGQDVKPLKAEGSREHIERPTARIRQVREHLFGPMDELGRPGFVTRHNDEGEDREASNVSRA